MQNQAFDWLSVHKYFGVIICHRGVIMFGHGCIVFMRNLF